MKETKFVAIPDCHIPYEDKRALNTALKIAEWYEPDEIVILGDFLDCAPVSHWNRKNLKERKNLNMADDFKLANKYLDRIQKITKKVTYLEGNHESIRRDTELLTTNGWKAADCLTKEDWIAQYNIETEEISFAQPTELVKHKAEKLVQLRSYNMNQSVTQNHDVIFEGVKVKAHTLLGREDLHEKQFPIVGYSEAFQSIPDGLTEDDLAFLTWICMDGTVVDSRLKNPNWSKIRLQFKLSYEHKINRLSELLTRMGIPFTFRKATMGGVNKLQPYYITVYGEYARKYFDLLGSVKLFPSWFSSLSDIEAKVVLDTIAETDGHRSWKSLRWISVEKHNIDIIQTLCLRTGRVCTVRIATQKSGFKNGKEQYEANIYENGLPPMSAHVHVTEEDYNDDAFCVTMPLGTIVTRLNGKVTITGNCWLQQAIDENPELDGLLDLDVNLKFEERGINFLRYNECYSIGKIAFTHGTYTNQHHALKHAEKFGRSIAYGHLHDIQMAISVSPIDVEDKHLGICLGCLAKVNPAFMKNRPSNWQHCVGVGLVRSSGDFNIDPIVISRGIASYAGKTFKS